MGFDIEIFDKDGNALHMGSLVSRYLFQLAEKHNMGVEDLVVGVELSQPIRDDGKSDLVLMDLDFNGIDGVLCSPWEV